MIQRNGFPLLVAARPVLSFFPSTTITRKILTVLSCPCTLSFLLLSTSSFLIVSPPFLFFFFSITQLYLTIFPTSRCGSVVSILKLPFSYTPYTYTYIQQTIHNTQHPNLSHVWTYRSGIAYLLNCTSHVRSYDQLIHFFHPNQTNMQTVNKTVQYLE